MNTFKDLDLAPFVERRYPVDRVQWAKAEAALTPLGVEVLERGRKYKFGAYETWRVMHWIVGLRIGNRIKNHVEIDAESPETGWGLTHALAYMAWARWWPSYLMQHGVRRLAKMLTPEQEITVQSFSMGAWSGWVRTADKILYQTEFFKTPEQAEHEILKAAGGETVARLLERQKEALDKFPKWW